MLSSRESTYTKCPFVEREKGYSALRFLFTKILCLFLTLLFTLLCIISTHGYKKYRARA